MKKSLKIAAAAICCGIIITAGVAGYNMLKIQALETEVGNYLKNSENESIAGNKEYFSIADGKLKPGKVSDEEKARALICSTASQMGNEISAEDLTDGGVEIIAGERIYQFSRKYQGISIYGGKVSVESDMDGNLVSIFGNFQDLKNIDIVPKIDMGEAQKKLLKVYRGADVYPEGLCIYTFNGYAELAWRFLCVTGDDVKECFISAHSGNLVQEVSQKRYYRETNIEGLTVEGTGEDKDGETVSFNTVKTEPGKYYLRDNSRNITVFNANKRAVKPSFAYEDENGNKYSYSPSSSQKIVKINGSTKKKLFLDISDDKSELIIVDEDKNIVAEGVHLAGIYLEDTWSWFGKSFFYMIENMFQHIEIAENDSTVWADKEAVTVIDRLSKVHDFFKDVLKRNGFDGKGSNVHLIYNDGKDTNEKNGYSWLTEDGVETLICFGTDSALSLDAVTHEFVHSVMSSINGGNDACRERKAIDEALCDIYGEIVEDYYDDGELNNSCDWESGSFQRSYKEPKQYKNPDYFEGDYWDFSENAEEHNNSTIISHAAYLMANEIDGTEEFEAVSMEEMSRLFYLTMYKIGSCCSFEELKRSMELAALEMYERGELTEKQVFCISEAFVRVGIGDKRIEIPKKEYEIVSEIDVYDGFSKSKMIYEHDENGNMINCARYVPSETDEEEYVLQMEYPSDFYIEETEYEKTYDEDGRLQKKENISEDGREGRIVEYTYDENGNRREDIRSWYEYNWDGENINYYDGYEIYNVQNRLIERGGKDENGRERKIESYEYDKKGIILTYTSYSENGEIYYSDKYEYEYNEHGWGTFVKIIRTDNQGIVMGVNEYEATYDEVGNLIRWEWRSDGKVRASHDYIYENGVLVKILDEDDSAVALGYDENGKCISETYYGSDGEIIIQRTYSYKNISLTGGQAYQLRQSFANTYLPYTVDYVVDDMEAYFDGIYAVK